MHADEPADLVHERLRRGAVSRPPARARGARRPRTPVGAMDGTRSPPSIAQHYRPGNMVVAAAGDVDHDAVAAEIERPLRRAARRGGAPVRDGPGRAPAAAAGATAPTEQAHLVVGLPRPSTATTSDRYALAVARPHPRRRPVEPAVPGDARGAGPRLLGVLLPVALPGRRRAGRVRRARRPSTRPEVLEPDRRRARPPGGRRASPSASSAWPRATCGPTTLLSLEDSGARMSRIGRSQLVHGAGPHARRESLERARRGGRPHDVAATSPPRSPPRPRTSRRRPRRRAASGSTGDGRRRTVRCHEPRRACSAPRAGWAARCAGRSPPSPGLELVAAVDPAAAVDLRRWPGRDAAGLPVAADTDALGRGRRRGRRRLHRSAAAAGEPAVVRRATASTPWSARPGSTDADLAEPRRGSRRRRRPNCVVAPNFAIGAVLMMRFAELAAPCFETASRSSSCTTTPRSTRRRARRCCTAERMARRAPRRWGVAADPTRTTCSGRPGGDRRRRDPHPLGAPARAWSPTKRSSSARPGRASRSAMTPTTAPRSCPACCWRCTGVRDAGLTVGLDALLGL